MPAPAPPTLWSATYSPDAGYGSDLDGHGDVDIAIVGGGYTGLWTALSLIERDASLRILVVERDTIGFGASGRNGGWCSALLPLGLSEIARRHGRDAAIAWQRAMFDTVDVVGRFAAASVAAAGVDPQFRKGGTITLAHNPHQLRRLDRAVDDCRRFGFSDDDVRLLDPSAAAGLCRADGVDGATYTPHCAAIHPLRLVHAIAAAASAAGVHIAEGVGVVGIEPRRLTTTAGPVRADVVVLATEAYTTQLSGRRRALLPIYSLMIGSEPLGDESWEAIGLANRETFTSASHLVVYGQRTADGRLAFGGRGAPYHYGSRIDDRFDTDIRVRESLRRIVVDLIPVLRDADFPYHWGGPLAAPRDWHPHVRYDERTGLAGAGGYVGDGVAAANLAGRTLADLIVRRDTDITHLPWVGHRSRRWEPEPLRWLGVHLVEAAAGRADHAETSGGRLAGSRAAAWWKLVEVLGGR